MYSFLDFNDPEGNILGIMVAAFSFGSLIVLPFVPWVDDRFGRKRSILLGSIFLVIGVVLQTASINREYSLTGGFEHLCVLWLTR
jgi:MFS family permease